jgi:putative SOS response-associated peptidase YedK
MCYRVACVIDIKEVADYFADIIIDGDIEQMTLIFAEAANINGFDHDLRPVIFTNREDWKLHLRLMEWGLIPHTVTDEEAFRERRTNMINARSERILDDPTSYWHKIRNRRCLIPVTGFYEHKAEPGFKHKIPYYIRLIHQQTFFIPGLYSVVSLYNKQTKEWEKRWTYTLITRAANSVMREIHNHGPNKWRMPLMLPLELSKLWLDEHLSVADYRAILNYEMSSEELVYWTVYTLGVERPDGLAAHAPYVWKKKQEELWG